MKRLILAETIVALLVVILFVFLFNIFEHLLASYLSIYLIAVISGVCTCVLAGFLEVVIYENDLVCFSKAFIVAISCLIAFIFVSGFIFFAHEANQEMLSSIGIIIIVLAAFIVGAFIVFGGIYLVLLSVRESSRIYKKKICWTLLLESLMIILSMFLVLSL